MAREARFLETAAPVLDLSAKSAVVMEQESKEILFAKDKDKELAWHKGYQHQFYAGRRQASSVERLQGKEGYLIFLRS